MAKEYYEILGIDENASEKEIKKAYRKKAKKYHPDSGSEDADEEKFKKINEAYQVLSDEEKRKKYDQFGKAGVSEEARRRARTDFSDFEDLFGSLFGDMFGGGFGQRGAGSRRDRDLRAKLEVSLKEAYQGTEKTLKVKRYKKCESCNGTGGKNGNLKTCPKCHGRGRTRKTRRTPFGQQTVVKECPKCGGNGRIPENPCPVCNGKGRYQDYEKIKIEVPEGISTGQKIRLNGKGNYGGPNSRTGDLYVVFDVKEHEYFERKEENLFYNLELTMPQAALGSEVEVPTMKGKVKITIPKGTQTGDIFRLKGKGMPRLKQRRRFGNNKGDLYIKAVVKTPEGLNKKEKELLKELRELEGEKAETEKGFFQTVKDNIKDIVNE